MKKLLLLVLCAQLSACPIHSEAEIRNDSENAIGFIWNGLASDSTKVDPGRQESVAMVWGTQCLTVIEEPQSFHFRIPERLPRGVQTTGRFDSIVGFTLVYDDSVLSFEAESGELIALETVAECERS